MSDSLRPPWTVAHQASPSMEFSGQEYWSGLSFPSPGDLPDPGRALVSCVAGRCSTVWATREWPWRVCKGRSSEPGMRLDGAGYVGVWKNLWLQWLRVIMLHCCFWVFFFFSVYFLIFFFISWRLISLQYCSGFCHILTWISHGFTCVPHPDPPSCLPLHRIPLGLPSAPALRACLMHPTNYVALYSRFWSSRKTICTFLTFDICFQPNCHSISCQP